MCGCRAAWWRQEEDAVVIISRKSQLCTFKCENGNENFRFSLCRVKRDENIQFHNRLMLSIVVIVLTLQ